MNRRGFLLGVPAVALGSGVFRPAWSAPLTSVCIADPGGWQIDPITKTLSFVPTPEKTGTTVLELHRFLQDELDKPENISLAVPSLRFTDEIIEVHENDFRVDRGSLIHMRNGSLTFRRTDDDGSQVTESYAFAAPIAAKGDW